jgi:hypothetical protein
MGTSKGMGLAKAFRGIIRSASNPDPPGDPSHSFRTLSSSFDRELRLSRMVSRDFRSFCYRVIQENKLNSCRPSAPWMAG